MINHPLAKKSAAIFLIWMLLLLPFSAALSITQITVAPKTNSAIVSFKTDEPATALVSVNGVGDFPINTATTPTTTHNIEVSGLSPNTEYSYTVQAATIQSTQPAISTSKQFTTLASNGEIYFTSDIPAVTGQSRLSMLGKTIPDGFVTVLVNDNIAASGVASPTGTVSLTFNLDTTVNENVVAIQVRDAATSVTQDYTYNVKIDTVFPDFDTIKIPSVSDSSTVQVTGSVNKPMSITAYAKYPDGSEKTFDKFDATGTFSTSVDLDEGVNQVLIVGTDASGAKVQHEQMVTVDSEELELDFDFSRYDPVISDTIYVDGFVNKPGINVRIYVDPKDKRVGNCETVSSVTITPSQTIEDSQCYGFRRFDQVTVDGAYFEAKSSTTANSNGMYPVSIEVRLEPRLSIYVQDKLPTSTTQNALDAANKDNRYSGGVGVGLADQYSLFAVALDNVGRTQATSTYRIHKEQCGDTGDFLVRIGQVYPDLIQPDHIFQGIAQISFKADLQYTGIGDSNSVVITDADISPRQVSDFDLEKLGTDPQEILEPSRCTISPASGITDYVYMVCDLNRFPASDVRTNITKAYKKLEDIGSIKFPVNFNIQYSLLDQNNRSVSRRASQCVDIAIRFDKRLSPDKYPKGLLKSTVKVLNTTVTSIDKVLKPLNTIKLVTLGACVGSKAFSLFSYASEAYVCASDGFNPVAQIKIEQAIKGCEDLSNCPALNNVPPGKSGDTELLAKDSECALKIQSRLSTEKNINYICDRIFCPAVPTASEYIKKINQNPTKSASSACATGATSNPAFLSGAQGPVSNLLKTEGCGKEYYDTWHSACPSIDPLAKSQKLAREANDRDSPRTFLDVVSNLNFCSAADRATQTKQDWITQGGNTYFNANPESESSCYQIGVSATAGKLDQNTLIADKNSIIQTFSAVNIKGLNGRNSTEGPINPDGCIVTTNKNFVIYQFRDPVNGGPVTYQTKDAIAAEVKEGNNVYSTSVVKFTAADGSTGGLDQQGNYYKQIGTQWEPVSENIDGKDKGFFAYACSNAINQNSAATEYGVYDSANKDCKAITNGPDQLKQNNGPPYVVNPTDGFINSLTCGCLPAIEGYLIVVRNVLNAVKNCFQATLVNGEFKAGACRSLLTTYLCDWIYRAIKCVTAFASGVEKVGQLQYGGSDTGIGAIQSIRTGADKMSKAMQDRYGNTATYSSLIGSRKIINSVCLAAFGYDWVPELDQAVSIKGGGAAINSTAFIVAADRRWISSDPTTGKSTFIYQAGYFVSAGSPINYQVYLVCSNDNSCRNSDGYSNSGQCDCAYPGSSGEKTYRIDGGVANGGETVGDADGKGQRLVKLDHDVRYDKVRLIFQDTVTPGAKEQVIEQRITRLGGQEPPTCTFNLLTTKFQCDYASTNKYGDVFFYGNKLQPEKDPYGINDKLNLAVFAKVDYTKQVGIEKQQIPPADQLPKYAKLQVWNERQTQLLYQEITPRATLQGLTDGQPLIMGAGYHIGDGQAPKGIAGTIRASGVPVSLGGIPEILPYEQNSFEISRASGKSIYYIIYGQYIAKPTTTGAFEAINADNDYHWIILRQSTESTGFTQPYESLSDINLRLKAQLSNGPSTSQGGYVTVLSNPNPYDSNTGILTIDRNNGVIIKLSSFSDKNEYSGRINYNTQSTSTLLCGPNQKSVNLLVTVSLHDSIAKDRTKSISSTNSDISPAVFDYQGVPQNQSKVVTVNCDGTSNIAQNTNDMAICPTDKLIWRNDYPVTNTYKLEGCYCGDSKNGNIFDKTSSKVAVCSSVDSSVSAIDASNFCTVGNNVISDCYCYDSNRALNIISNAPSTPITICHSPNKCLNNNGVYSCTLNS